MSNVIDYRPRLRFCKVAELRASLLLAEKRNRLVSRLTLFNDIESQRR